MIARHYGKKISIRYLHEISDLNRLGMSLRDIMDVCRCIDLDSVALRLDCQYAQTMPLPAIIYWKQQHFVVLYNITRKKGKRLYHIADPANGKIIYSEKDFLSGCMSHEEDRGLVVLVEPNDEFSQREFQQSNIGSNFCHYLKSFLKGYRITFIQSMLITIIIMVADLRVYSQALDGNVYHYRDSNGLECDAVVHLRNGEYGLIEIKLGGDKLIEEGVTNLLKLEQIMDTTRMKRPAFKMILTATGQYAFRRPDGVYIVPIGCLRD